MQTLEVKLNAVRTQRKESANVVIESKDANEVWKKDRDFSMVTGDKSERQTIALNPGQRVIIEAASPFEVVMDRDQNQAVLRPKDPVERAKMEQQEKEQLDREAREDQERRARIEAAARGEGPEPSAEDKAAAKREEPRPGGVGPSTASEPRRPIAEGDTGKAANQPTGVEPVRSPTSSKEAKK